MGDLEALKAVTALGFTSDNIENLVDKFGALGVVTLCPVVSCEVMLLIDLLSCF